MYTREVEVTTNVHGVLPGLIAGDLEVGLNQARDRREGTVVDLEVVHVPPRGGLIAKRPRGARVAPKHNGQEGNVGNFWDELLRNEGHNSALGGHVAERQEGMELGGNVGHAIADGGGTAVQFLNKANGGVSQKAFQHSPSRSHLARVEVEEARGVPRREANTISITRSSEGRVVTPTALLLLGR